MAFNKQETNKTKSCTIHVNVYTNST